MTYQFARIDLAQTDYEESVDWKYLEATETVCRQLDEIYRTYCIYKHFASVMPMFWSRYQDPASDIIGYYDQGQLVAWSLIRRYDQHNALCYQFAWNYHNPKKRLGIATLQTECAIYKARNFDYLYLDQAHLYKHALAGFEILGPME